MKVPKVVRSKQAVASAIAKAVANGVKKVMINGVTNKAANAPFALASRLSSKT
jgi:hypothetical protein